MKIAVCLHLFYTDMLDDIISYLNNLKHPYDLYVSLVNGFFENGIIGRLKSFKPNVKIVYVENKGVDIGGFLNCLKIIDNNTDLILKIHTKKGIGLPNNPSAKVKKAGIDATLSHGRQWFHGLMKGVLSDEGKVNRILDKFKNNNKCGMVGYKLYNNSSVNKNNIINLLPLFGLDTTYLDKNFIGGTIFWVRYEIIKKYFTENVISQIMDKTHFGYVIEPSTMHAVERIFGYIVTKENKEVIKID